MKSFRWSRMTVFVLLIIVSMLTMGLSSPDADKQPQAKNVIVMIADGRGFNSRLAASYYEYGKANGQIYTKFPYQVAMSTYELYRPGDDMTPLNNYDLCYGRGYDTKKAWKTFEYMRECYTDSAAAATAMATGVKTYDGGLGVDINGNPVQNVVEAAEEMGKSTGVITSVPFSHATPAGFVIHNVTRNDYLGIADSMILTSGADVIMGAGHPFYDTDGNLQATPTYKYISQPTWDALVAGTAGGDADGDGVADPWTMIQDRSEFQALQTGDTPERVFGLAETYDTLQQDRSGDAYTAPFVEPFVTTVPTLVEMTNGALNVLDNDPDGFFLMVEGGATDWAAHAGESGRLIEEHIDYDASVQAVVDWVKANSNWRDTLLIIANDHETGYVWGPGSGETDEGPVWKHIRNYGAGMVPGMDFYSELIDGEFEHSNSLVPVFAKGEAGALIKQFATSHDKVRGKYMDNTDLAKIIFMAMGQ